MTVDELLKDLMKIKEIYPDSGKFHVVMYYEDESKDYLICALVTTVKKNKLHDQVRLETS